MLRAQYQRLYDVQKDHSVPKLVFLQPLFQRFPRETSLLYSHGQMHFFWPLPAADTGTQSMILRSRDAIQESRETSTIQYPRKHGHCIPIRSGPWGIMKMQCPPSKKNTNGTTCCEH